MVYILFTYRNLFNKSNDDLILKFEQGVNRITIKYAKNNLSTLNIVKMGMLQDLTSRQLDDVLSCMGKDTFFEKLTPSHFNSVDWTEIAYFRLLPT